MKLKTILQVFGILFVLFVFLVVSFNIGVEYGYTVGYAEAEQINYIQGYNQCIDDYERLLIE